MEDPIRREAAFTALARAMPPKEVMLAMDDRTIDDYHRDDGPALDAITGMYRDNTFWWKFKRCDTAVKLVWADCARSAFFEAHDELRQVREELEYTRAALANATAERDQLAEAARRPEEEEEATTTSPAPPAPSAAAHRPGGVRKSIP